MFKWLFLFAALFPGLAVSGLNGGATISYKEDYRELTLQNSEQGYWWKHTDMHNFRQFYEADLDMANAGGGNDPTGRDGFLLIFPSSWTPSPGSSATWGSFKFFSNNGEYKHDWPKITDICMGCEFYVRPQYATNPVALTFTSTQADGNYTTTLEYMGAWKTNQSTLPSSMPTHHIHRRTVDYHVLGGKVYFGRMATSCDITTQDLVMNFGNVPPGTTSNEKMLQITIKCNTSSGTYVPVRIGIQGDEYSGGYAIKRGEVADTYLSIFCDDFSGGKNNYCYEDVSNSGLSTTLFGKITTKNKAGAFEEHYVVTVEID